MKGSRFYSSLFLLIILNALIKPVWLLAIDRQVQNHVGPSSYGQYFAIFNLTLILSFLADLGFTNFYNRQLAAEDAASKNLSTSFLSLKLLLIFVYACLVFGIAGLTGIQRWDLLIPLVFVQIFTSLLLYFRSIITANQWFREDAWISVLDKSLMIVLCGSVILIPTVFGPINTTRFSWLQACCIGLAVLISVIVLYKRSFPVVLRHIKLPPKKLLVQVFPFGLIVLLMAAHARLDAFLLERIHPNGAFEAGMYASAYRLLDIANMVGYLLASFMLPYVARQWSNKQPFGSVVLNLRHLLLTYSITVVGICYFLAPWIEQLLYQQTDSQPGRVLQLCIPALIGYSLTQIYGTVLTATGFIKSFCRITVVSLILNVTLNLFLIPTMGAKGCGIAALCSQLFNGIVVMLYAQRKLKLSLQPRTLLLYILQGIALVLFFSFVADGISNNWILIIIAALISLVALALTGIAGLKSILNINQPQP